MEQYQPTSDPIEHADSTPAPDSPTLSDGTWQPQNPFETNDGALIRCPTFELLSHLDGWKSKKRRKIMADWHYLDTEGGGRHVLHTCADDGPMSDTMAG